MCSYILSISRLGSSFTPSIGTHKLSPDCNRSHNTIWGYDATDNNGLAVARWTESNGITLIHDGKLPTSFNSARCKKGYSQDLIFASSSIDNMCVKSVLNHIPLPHSTSHLCVTVNPVIVSRSTAFRRRFNINKE